MILAVDAGNTDIVFGLSNRTEWVRIWRIPSNDGPKVASWQYRLINELLELGLSPPEIEQVVISSVVPALNQALFDMLAQNTGKTPLMVGPAVYPKLGIGITKPDEIGTDLVANAVAAYDRFRSCCIVVDFGTALTFTTVSDAGEIIGVAIAPGLRTAVNSLFKHTAQLPEVPLEVPDSALGQDTIHAIQAGVVLGYTGMVTYLVDHIRDELGKHTKVIATGGLSEVLTSLKDYFDAVDRKLTLNGLLLIGEQAIAN